VYSGYLIQGDVASATLNKDNQAEKIKEIKGMNRKNDRGESDKAIERIGPRDVWGYSGLVG
jgi:hypothetical protein